MAWNYTIGSWNLNWKVFMSYLLGLCLNIDPINIDVEINILFHLSQIHIIEVSYECDIIGNIQLINDICFIKFKFWDFVLLFFYEVSNGIILFSTFTLDVCSYQFKLKVFSDVWISFFNSGFVKFLVICILNDLFWFVFTNHCSKFSNVNMVIVIIIV